MKTLVSLSCKKLGNPVIGFFLLGIALAPGIASAQQNSSPQSQNESAGSNYKIAPEFIVQKWINTDSFQIKDSFGYVIVLLYWRSFQGEYHPLIPGFLDIANKYKNQGVKFLGISSEPEKKLIENAKKLKITFPLGLDYYLQTSIAFDVREIPVAFVINSLGRLEWRGDPFVGNDLETAILAAIKGGGKLIGLRKDLDTAKILFEKENFTESFKSLLAIQSASKNYLPIHLIANNFKNQIETLGQEAYQKAEGRVKKGFYLSGISALKEVSQAYSGTKAAKEASFQSIKLENDKQFSHEKKAMRFLDYAKRFMRKKRRNRTEIMLKYIMEFYPNTEASNQANWYLKNINKI